MIAAIKWLLCIVFCSGSIYLVFRNKGEPGDVQGHYILKTLCVLPFVAWLVWAAIILLG